MLRQPSTAPAELILSISVTTEGKLIVRPEGLGDEVKPFLLSPVLSAEEERHFNDYLNATPRRDTDTGPAAKYVAEHLQPLGDRYYEQLFAPHPRLAEWLDERITAGSGRLLFIGNDPATLRELWETLRTPNQKPVVLQGIKIERRFTAAPSREPGFLPGPSLRVLYVLAPAGGGGAGSEGRAARIRDIFGDAMVPCAPPSFEQLTAILDDARSSGRPFQVIHFDRYGFFAFLNQSGRGELYFERHRDGAADRVSSEQLRLALRDVRLVVLEAETKGQASSLAAVASPLLEQGVPAVITTSDRGRGPGGERDRCMARLYADLRAGKTVGQAANAGRQELLFDLSFWTLKVYQQGPDARLLEPYRNVEPGSSAAQGPAPGPKALPAVGSEPVLAAAPGILGSSRGRLVRSGAFLLALSMVAVFLFNHVREERRQKEQAAEKLRLAEARTAEKSRIEETVKQCLNRNAFHCQEALHVAEDCTVRKIDDFWPGCSYYVGRIKEEALTGQLDLPGALAAYAEACSGGYALACLNLGNLEERGRGLLSPAPLAARRDYERGCQLNNLEACANAGLLYVTNDPAQGLVPDAVLAEQFYARACNDLHGIPRGCTGLGTLLSHQHKEPAAFNLFNFACTHGDLLGCTRRGDLSPNRVEKQDSYRQACGSLDNRSGACTGCIPLAKSYEQEPDREQAAVLLYEELCESGCNRTDSLAPSCCHDPEVRGTACRWLGWILEHGELHHPKNRQGALRAYRQACDSGDRNGCELWSRLNAPRNKKSKASLSD